MNVNKLESLLQKQRQEFQEMQQQFQADLSQAQAVLAQAQTPPAAALGVQQQVEAPEVFRPSGHLHQSFGLLILRQTPGIQR